MMIKARSVPFLAHVLLGLVYGLVGAVPAFAVDEIIDSLIYKDPEIPAARVVKVFRPELLPLWLRALERPETDLKYQAATTIALAHRRGMPGLEAAVPPLLRALDQPEQPLTVRLAVAQALITLDARQATPSLFKHAQADGIDMRDLIEPALMRWNYEPIRAVWLERLSQLGIPGRGWLLAMQGLGAARESRAVARLRELTLSSDSSAIIRLEAARTLGAIQTTGLEKDAEHLASGRGAPGNVLHLAAASLLRKHRTAEATRILQRLAVEAEAAAAAVAIEGLLEADARLVLPLLKRVVANPDAAVRKHGIEAHRQSPLPEHIPMVAELLDDPHPEVRISARKALLAVARGTEHGDLIRREATRLLATNRWRALEQATYLLVGLDHKPTAPRLEELLSCERPEVFVAAAWGLRKLAVPETLPAQLREIQRRWEQSLKPSAGAPRAMIDVQVAQLAQSLGKASYSSATPVLALFIPKQWNIGRESRAAAIWALGLIHQKGAPASLVEALLDRVTDDSVNNVEDLGVRTMSAVALGRMKATQATDSLREYYPRKLTTESFPNACGWALQQLTGELLPTSGTAEQLQRGWFLEPSK